MKESVTQEFEYGCGVACFAFVLGITYKKAAELLGEVQANSERFWIKDLNAALNKHGLSYERKYVKPHIRPLLEVDGAIVLIGRSKTYATGHYLVRHGGMWMDPWINMPKNKGINKAKSGYRKHLPGVPKYVIYPASIALLPIGAAKDYNVII